MVPAQDLRSTYIWIIDDVMSKIKPEFVAHNVDECVAVPARLAWLPTFAIRPGAGAPTLCGLARYGLCRQVLRTVRDRWEQRMQEKGLLDAPEEPPAPSR